MSSMIMIFLMNMIALSSKNIISMWYYMEIASFIFIYFIIKMNNPIKSPVIYFIMSFITSFILFLSIVISNFNSMEMNLFLNFNTHSSILIMMAFILKMGMIPLHSWVYKMSENMQWTSLMIMFSIQKIIPIWAIMSFSKIKILMMIISVSMIILPWLPLKSKNSYFLLTTSGIVNNIWIILASFTSSFTSITYVTTYFMINTNFIYILKKNNSKILNSKNSINMLISIMSLMGFPPTPNFFIKLMVMKNMFLNNLVMLFIMMMIMFMNMISSIMYIKFIILSILNISNTMNWKNFKNNKNTYNLMINLFPTVYFMSMIFF